MSESAGRLAIVLHSHSPWLLGHGSWPVGEEWLHQAWGHAYIPLVRMLRERAERGARSQITLGITPVLAAQWDRPDAIAEQRRWLADWRLRAEGKGLQATARSPRSARSDRAAADDARRQFRLADERARDFDEHWSAGGSAAIRPLADAGVVELLGGPMTHTFTPHLLPAFAHAALDTGVRDHTVRLGARPDGIWAPECAYAPGLEGIYAAHGVQHLMVDGPTIQATGQHLHRPYRIGFSDVVAFGRDLELTYRVWSPKRGYPGNEWYQDFHTFDHEWGLRPYRVTRKTSPVKAMYEPERAAQQVAADARDFLDTARRVLLASPEPEPLVVVAYDTELFGHWWHEGPQFLAQVLDHAADAGIELTTLGAERARAQSADDLTSIDLPAGSWGSGKDYRVWADGEAGQLRDRGIAAQYAVLDYLQGRTAQARAFPDSTADAIVTELFLAMSSDWAFMITKDSAVEYARGRADEHFSRLGELLRAVHHDPALVVRDARLPFVDARAVPLTL